jgi:hypothetical protein
LTSLLTASLTLQKYKVHTLAVAAIYLELLSFTMPRKLTTLAMPVFTLFCACETGNRNPPLEVSTNSLSRFNGSRSTGWDRRKCFYLRRSGGRHNKSTMGKVPGGFNLCPTLFLTDRLHWFACCRRQKRQGNRMVSFAPAFVLTLPVPEPS